VFHEIGGDLVQTLVGSDDLLILAEQLIKQRRLIRIELGFLDLLRDPAV
jgi:hypothetical protein